MNWKQIGRALVCLLVICCLVVNISPIRARATGLEIALVGVSAALVVGAVLIGLGVLPQPDMTAFNNLVNSCVSTLSSAGTHVLDGMVNVARVINGQKLEYSVQQELIEDIRSWLFSSGTVVESSDIVFSDLVGTGIAIDSTDNYASAYAWAESIDLYSLANSAAPGSFFMVSCNASSVASAGIFRGFRIYEHPGYGINLITGSQVSSLAGYLSDSYPVGSFVPNSFSVTTITTTNFGFSSSILSVPQYLCLNYSDAIALYNKYYAGELTVSGLYINFLTPDTYYQPNLATSSSSYVTGYSLYNYGRIALSTGVVSYGNSGSPYIIKASNSSSSNVNYPIIPASSSVGTETTYTVSDGLTAGVIASPSTELEVGYTTWVGGATTYPGTGNSEGDETEETHKYWPVFMPDTYEGLSEVSQEDVWSGTQVDPSTDADTGTTTDTVTASGLKGWLQEMLDAIGGWFKTVTAGIQAIPDLILEGIKSLFVPTEGYIESKLSSLSENYSFADSIVRTGLELRDFLFNLGTMIPVIYIDLGAATGSYYLGGYEIFVDLTWYAAYKPTVDAIISAFLWLWFVWRMLVSAPGIIQGVQGTPGSPAPLREDIHTWSGFSYQTKSQHDANHLRFNLFGMRWGRGK